MKLLEIFFIILFSKLQVSSSDDISKYIRKLIKQQNSLHVGIHEVIIYNFGNQRNNWVANDLMNQLARFVPKQNPIVVSKSSDVSGRSESFRIIIRPVTAALYKKEFSKLRQWRSLGSSVIVLRLKKYDNIGNFHRKKVSTPSECESMSAIIEFLSILGQKL